MFHLRVTICYSMIKYRCQIYINIYTFSRVFSLAFLLIYEGQMIPTRNKDDDEPDVIGKSFFFSNYSRGEIKECSKEKRLSRLFHQFSETIDQREVFSSGYNSLRIALSK